MKIKAVNGSPDIMSTSLYLVSPAVRLKKEEEKTEKRIFQLYYEKWR